MDKTDVKVLAELLKDNTTVTDLNASSNAMGTAGAKGFGDMLLVNKTIQTLDVSDNSFGKMQVGDEVKIKSSGEMCTVFHTPVWIKSSGELSVKTDSKQSSAGNRTGWFNPSDFEWESQVPAFCAGVAASPSLISVSTTFRHALAVSISHSSPLSYHVRSSMYLRMAWAWTAERP